MSLLRCIIFDFGGVISTCDALPNDNLSTIAEALAKKYQKPLEPIDQITLSGWLNARTNPRHDPIFWNELAKSLGITITQLQEDFLSFPKAEATVVDLIKRLRPRYQVAMLSNQIATWHQILMAEWHLNELFDPIVTSYGEGVAKPDQRIYECLLEKVQLPGEACLYIDDVEANLVPARALGMKTILFTSPTQLLKDIEPFIA